LCALADIPDGGGREWVRGAGETALRVLLLRRETTVWGYLNRCPHFSLPLNYEPDTFCTYDAQSVMCAHHSAMFRFDDGACYDGPCLGHRLMAVPVRCDGESVFWD
jgi:nitrite reductase/ring-hydroxylating ferredoxin subunit